MAVCKNCGATIEDKEVKCPFCSALQYDAAEEQYMDNLYKVNETMDHLDDQANALIRKEILLKGAVTLAAIALAVCIGAFIGYQRNESRSFYSSGEVKELEQWYEAHIDELNHCLETGDYETMDEIISKNRISGLSDLWEGYSVCQVYISSMSSVENYKGYLAKYEKEDVSYYYRDLYQYALTFLHDEGDTNPYHSISKVKKYYPQVIAQWDSECRDVLENILGISKEQYEKDIEELFRTGYIDSTECRNRAEAYYNIYKESK